MPTIRTTSRKRVGNGQLFRRLFGVVPQKGGLGSSGFSKVVGSDVKAGGLKENKSIGGPPVIIQNRTAIVHRTSVVASTVTVALAMIFVGRDAKVALAVTEPQAVVSENVVTQFAIKKRRMAATTITVIRSQKWPSSANMEL
ncbi:hypothetical protein AgCh_028535 [Apium graveolens]